MTAAMHQAVHLLHIGKTGCTALQAALRPWRDVGPWNIKLHLHDVTLDDVPPGEKVIFFLRHPVTRFVSGFYSRQRQGRPRYRSPWSPDERRAFGNFATPGALALALSDTDPERRRRAEAAMGAIGHVRTSFYDWIESDAYLAARAGDVMLIGFQERLEEDFRRMKGLLELPADIALPDDDTAAHRNPAMLDRGLGDEATTNLCRWYARDIALFERLMT